jgi:hypothetical protein
MRQKSGNLSLDRWGSESGIACLERVSAARVTRDTTDFFAAELEPCGQSHSANVAHGTRSNCVFAQKPRMSFHRRHAMHLGVAPRASSAIVPAAARN